MRVRKYSDRSIKTYISLLRQVSKFHHLSPAKISYQQIKDYLDYRIRVDKISVSSINQTISAFKILFVYVLKRQWNEIEISRPRREVKLPVVFSTEEIIKLLNSTKNLKHEAIFALAYSSGVRLNELCKLKIKDIDSERMQIRIENGKGRKDRYTILSKKALKILREYFKKYRPVDYLFFGYDKKKAIRDGTVQKAFKKNLKNSGIIKDAHFHTLRHTFATHLLEQNVNIKIIQKLLGHSSIQTTIIYTHLVNFDLSKMKSPLDNL